MSDILVQYNPTLYPDWDKFVELLRTKHAKDLRKHPVQIVDLDGEPLVTLARKMSLAWFKQKCLGIPFPGDRR